MAEHEIRDLKPLGGCGDIVGGRPRSLSPVPDTPSSLSSTARRLPAYSTREESNDYQAVVAVLDQRWRVIECQDRIQWILQRRRGSRDGLPAWRGESFCRIRSALLQCIHEKSGDVDLGVVVDLPDHFRASDELPASEGLGHAVDGEFVK